MTTQDALQRVLDESRNGMNSAIRYSPLFPRFLISDGARDACDAADCYWLVDLLASEISRKLTTDINAGLVGTTLVSVVSKDGKAVVNVTTSDECPPYWSKHIDLTSFPEGDWTPFELGAFDWDSQGNVVRLILTLITEH